MSGSYRPGRPHPSDNRIDRHRLVSRLDRRWSCRLVTVVAGPGFGKTSVVIDAVERCGPDHHDVWISCTPNDEEADVLLRALGESLGLQSCTGVGDIVSAVWLRAPDHVCFVFDDLHEIATNSAGAEVCRQLAADLPRNGHLLITSRSTVPIPVARLGSLHELERITEHDLLFDDDELARFARLRGVALTVVGSSGGWPALAELAAAADDDLVYEYVWDEVLSSIGPERAVDLARLAAAGDADDAIARSVVPDALGVHELVEGLPLVERRANGWVGLHALWGPILRPLLTAEATAEVRRTAAAVHLQAGRLDAAIELLRAAEAWDEVMSVIRLAELDPNRRLDGRAFGRWANALPDEHRSHPVARFAFALDLAARLPREAGPMLVEAAAAFRSTGDIEGEVAALHEHGFELWWANDVEGLIALISRVTELAETGSEFARMLVRVGDAGIAHLSGDSAAVLRALDGIDDPGTWAAGIGWLRHVAHRRNGDTVRAALALDGPHVRHGSAADPQLRLARLRLDWLEGRPDAVPDGIRAVAEHYRCIDNRYLHAESSLELATKLAWIGDREEAEALLRDITPQLPDLPGALVRVLWLIASAASAIDAGDEELAHALLEDEELAEPERADNWYWCDRTATALPYVLLPRFRDRWAATPRAPVHRPGIVLAAALVAARAGDDAGLRSLTWPAPGAARVHLPDRWLAELVVAAGRAGNPAPDELIHRCGTAHMAADVHVLGPLTIRIGGVGVDHPDLRRSRVRELVQALIVHRNARREVLADALWPDHLEPRHNLRVTLGYLQGAIDPGRERGAPSAYLRANRSMIAFVETNVRCDLWDLDMHLTQADQAERCGDPSSALRAYDRALPLWIGPPFEEIAHLDWARDEQTRWRRRYGAAAIRCAELHLAAGAIQQAVDATEHALRADSYDEQPYRIAARAHLSGDDPMRARAVLDGCLTMLTDLGIQPSAQTTALLAGVEAQLTRR